MNEIRARIIEVLEQGHVMTVATIDDGGVWAGDVEYVNDDFELYWLSRPDTRRSRALEDHSQISGTITVQAGPDVQDLGVQFSGNAQRIHDVHSEIPELYLEKRGAEASASIDDLMSRGFVWYHFVPDYYELIDEAEYGHDKQIFKIDR